MAVLSNHAMQKLRGREALQLDPSRQVAIKRAVHELVISAAADDFAAALRVVLRDPHVELGAIDLKRAASRLGDDFVVGERFHGCVRLARLGRPLLAALGRTRLGAWLEDELLSDYAEVVAAEPRRVVYRYLSGTPMAGTSTLLITPLSSTTSRFRVVFEYQEQSGVAILALHHFGLRMHDRATAIQAERAAELIGARVLHSTVPR